jgi:hypothetical protein
MIMKYFNISLSEITSGRFYRSFSRILILAIVLYSCHNHSGMYNIVDYGAKGNGKTINTKAINAAIRACNKNGGGIVVVPTGKFVSGTIHLLSDITLKLETGSAIIGSTDISDYIT